MKKNWSELEGEDQALLEELSGALDTYRVPPAKPGMREAVAQRTAGMLQPRPSPVSSLREQLRIQARFLPWWYYVASVVLCMVGVGLLWNEPYYAYRIGIVIGMTPLPLLLGLLEVFHGADEGMGEIESACRYSTSRVMSARMLIVGLLSMVVAAILGIASGLAFSWMAVGVVVVPFCGSAALGLVLSAVLRGRASSAQVALAIALTNGAAALASVGDAGLVLPKLTPVGWLLAMVLAVLAMALALKTIFSEDSRLLERKLLQWN